MATTIQILVKTATRENGKWIVTPRKVPLILNSLAPLSTTANVNGEWASTSRYVGKSWSGKYYVRSDHKGSLGWPAPGVPVGYFLEPGDEIPFMIMFNCLPQKLEAHWYGMFIRTYDLVDDLKFEWFKDTP